MRPGGAGGAQEGLLAGEVSVSPLGVSDYRRRLWKERGIEILPDSIVRDIVTGTATP